MTDTPHPGSAPHTSPTRRALAMVLSLLLIGALGYWLLSVLNHAFSFAGTWEGKVLRAVPSPDGRYVAEVSEWNGGATTGFETRVGLRRPTDRNTVTGGPQKDATVAKLFSSPPVKLRWDTPQQLTVESPGGQLMDHRETWRDVRIIFKGTR